MLISLLLIGLPWLPARREAEPAEVHLDFCNGCSRCVEDCPYSAITLVPRSDGAPFQHEVVVDPARCVACGICMGACPSSSPFRRSGPLITGIDLPGRPLEQVRAEVVAAAADLTGPGRIMTIACEHGAAAMPEKGRVVLPCVAMAPPSLFDFILSRDLADGVCIAGCAERDCQNRLGVKWTEERIARTRDPMLRQRVPRERLLTIWKGPSERGKIADEIKQFSDNVAALGPVDNARPLNPDDLIAVGPSAKSEDEGK
jgi:ferredoxin/coenzyme F420-reducing hydrogenase delta subunit